MLYCFIVLLFEGFIVLLFEGFIASRLRPFIAVIASGLSMKSRLFRQLLQHK